MAIFRLYLPFLDDVKAKGVKTAVKNKIEDVVTRITTGMNSTDVRLLLRDDPVGRPNPRLKPHTESFWFHIKPTYYNQLMDGFYPTFRLGWLSTYFFVFEIITGIYLMIFYTPSPVVAYENMRSILSNVPYGDLMRDLHKLGAEAMVAIVGLHMLRTFVTGSYKKPRQFTWLTGIILLIVTLGLSFSGYLLPWDQLSLWAVTIGASMVEAFPPEVVGSTLNLIVRGAPEFGAGGLCVSICCTSCCCRRSGDLPERPLLQGRHPRPQPAAGGRAVGEDTAKRIPMESRCTSCRRS
jgi:hypothetical protein